MTWFLPERELHLHKLSWRPRENSKEEVSPGPGSSTPGPRTAVQSLSAGPGGAVRHTSLCPDHTQHGAQEPSAFRAQIISGQHTCDPSDAGDPGGTKGRPVELENPRTRATRPPAKSLQHLTVLHTLLSLPFNKPPRSCGPRELSESTACPAQALLSGPCPGNGHQC